MHITIRTNNCVSMYIQLTVAECICYDDGCHLRRFAQNPVRCDLTGTSKLIANLKIFIDRLHFMGHTDDWCRQNCNPDTLPLLQNVSFVHLYTCSSVILVIT